MNIYAQEGTKVLYTGNGGNSYDGQKAGKWLKVGKEYTVHHTDVHSWYTNVYLKEIGDHVWFNSVMFRDTTDGKESEAEYIDRVKPSLEELIDHKTISATALADQISVIINQDGDDVSDGEVIDQITDLLKKYELYKQRE